MLAAHLAPDSPLANRPIIDIDCPTQHITIKKDGAYFYSLKSREPKRYLSLNDIRGRLRIKGIGNPSNQEILTEMAYYVLANEATSCWNAFGKGLDPFKSGIFLPESVCVVCSEVSFDSSYVDALRKTGFNDLYLKNFVDYLKVNKYNDKMSYWDFLTPVSGESYLVGGRLDAPTGIRSSWIDIDGNTIVVLSSLQAGVLARVTGTVSEQQSLVDWYNYDSYLDSGESLPTCEVLY